MYDILEPVPVTLLPGSLENYVTADNPVRVIDVFIEEPDPEATGRPPYI